MKNLIVNELLKLHYRKKFIITSLILLSISILICIGMYEINKFSSPENQLKSMEGQVSNLKERKNDSKVSEKEKENINNEISSLEMQISMMKIEISSSKNDNWKEPLKNNLSALEDQLKNIDSLIDDNSKEEIYKNYITTKYLLDHNINPASKSSLNAYNGLENLIQALGSVFLLIVVAIISADIVSGEYTPPTMKVLLTKPISRSKVILSKFLAAIISSTAIIVVTEILLFLIMGIFWGFGSPSYPIIIGTKYQYSTIKTLTFGNNLVPIFKSSRIIPVWNFTIRIILLQILFIIATAAFCFLFSTVLKSSMLSMTVSILGTIALNIFTSIPFFRKVSPFIFTTYSNSIGILQGNVAPQYNSTLISPWFAVLILVLWTAICYFISDFTFRKKDILV